MIRTIVLTAVAAAGGWGVTRAVLAGRGVIDRRGRLDRTNHAGSTVSLIEGPAVAAGLTTAAVLVAAPSHRTAAVTATAVSGILGFVDDVAESGSAKGLRGHLGALARGEITTGALKVIGIPAAALLAAGVGRRPEPLGGSAALGALTDTVLAAGVIAGTANLLNLLDLRPGRALKAGLLALAIGESSPRTGTVLTGGALGVIAAAWPDDLAGSSMLGDTGANALGAYLGTRYALSASRPRLALELTLLGALTLASEKVSFTAVIARTPVLRELDAWGRPAALVSP
ncbi:hypothetical protein GCM10022261_27460 [Brevibacterium daeguense]|uniref:UDP-N-acetylmuramyl pentapeptide phosphotransferase/UDP-N-acetylglucosamine-1-phosphate transferase n=1 Tax=Brevibacterium daeguense TaxID=909936 RepID=A0ABP8EMJ3_9MICO|nr:hypothetical protein [Brevibacterium daeguense]